MGLVTFQGRSFIKGSRGIVAQKINNQKPLGVEFDGEISLYGAQVETGGLSKEISHLRWQKDHKGCRNGPTEAPSYRMIAE